jgi:DnaJ-class molecular chaperone
MMNRVGGAAVGSREALGDDDGGSKPRWAQQNGTHLGSDVAISVREAFAGVAKWLRYDRHMICRHCSGTRSDKVPSRGLVRPVPVPD